MKNGPAIKRFFFRTSGFLVFAAVCAAAGLLALGILKIAVPGQSHRNETSRTETQFLENPTDTPESSSFVSPEDTFGYDTQTPTETTSGYDITGESTSSPSDPPNMPLENLSALSELESKGYSLSWESYHEGMKLASLFSEGVLPTVYSYGNTLKAFIHKSEPVQVSGIELPSNSTVNYGRKAVELYMGYILLDTGNGPCTDIFPGYTTVTGENGEKIQIRTDRARYNNVNTVTILNSKGKTIGVYKAEQVIIAYTRDLEGRPLFYSNGAYYYIDESTGDFLLSDYNDETDNRGLYFDYNPGYGLSDCNIKKFHTMSEVAMHYTMDTASVYTRTEIDWRIAKELTLAYPSYASKVALHNIPFSVYYKTALKVIEAERKAAEATATTAAATAASPETSSPNSTEFSQPAGSTVSETTLFPSGEPVTPSELMPDNLTAPISPDNSSADETGQSSDAASQEATEPDPSASSGMEETESTEPETTPEETTSKIYEVTKTVNDYRFIYAAVQPKADLSYITTLKPTYSQHVTLEVSWTTQYKYAEAYNFREGRAVTLDDNGVVRIINTSGATVVHLNQYHNNEYYTGTKLRQFYMLPPVRDVSQLGSFYYDEGLLRIIRADMPYNARTVYERKEDILIDLSGKQFPIPSGYSLYAYSEGMLILERNGLYGIYSKSGHWLVQPQYTSAQPFVEGLCVLTDANGNCGMIDKTGKVILPFAYKFISNASSGLISCYSEAAGWTVIAKASK